MTMKTYGVGQPIPDAVFNKVMGRPHQKSIIVWYVFTIFLNNGFKFENASGHTFAFILYEMTIPMLQ